MKTRHGNEEAFFEAVGKAIASRDKHIHKYVIPVEWEYIHKAWHELYGKAKEETPIGKIVTVLRCECGKEIDR